MERIRVLIAEDHEAMLKQIENLIRPVFEVVASAIDGPSALAAAERCNADVAVLDITMPGMNGFDVARELRSRGSSPGVVFLSIHDDPDYRQRAVDSGALGYVTKPRMTQDLINAIAHAAAGRRYFAGPTGSEPLGSQE
jgi:DNA-binding NarL/FixJ family response regulator